MTQLNIRISDELADRLDELAVQRGRTKRVYAREALKEKLDELEAYYLSIHTFEEIVMGQSRVWTQEEIEKNIT